MAKTYRIWAVIEEHDDEADEYHDVSDQTPITEPYENLDEAMNQLHRLEAVGGTC